MLSFFTISHRDRETINSPVFHFNSSGSDEAVAVFSTKQSAQQYLEDAKWEATDQVVELGAGDLLCWLAEMSQSGVAYVVVNPQRERQEQGLSQRALSLRELLDELGEMLVGKLHAPAPHSDSHLRHVNIYHCQECGAMVEQRAGRITPVCCGREMELSVTSTREEPLPSK